MGSARVLVFSVIFALLAVSPARAVPLRDIVELSRAGLSDDVIVALIEVDQEIYSLEARQILELREAGVSERVLLALLRSGRGRRVVAAEHAVATETPDQVAAPAQPAPGPNVVVVDHDCPPAQTIVTPVLVPTFFGSRPRVLVAPDRDAGAGQSVVVPHPFGRFINDGVMINDQRPAQPPAPEPVYWGWGGRLRPGAWKPGH